MQDVVKWLKENGNLKVIDEPLDVELEIPHVAYVEVKTDNSRPILFTNPINKKKNIKYDMPVLMNIFANKALTEKIFEKHPDDVAKGIDKLLKLKPPAGFMEKLKMLPELISLKNVFPKRSSKLGACQEVIIPKEEVDLDKLPILKTWEEDGGAFITMGQVYTQSLDGSMQNLGMYRLQQYDKNHLGMHWQIHKDASHFFDQYQKAGKKMPVTVAIGGDPLYIWCGQAPMPHGMFEMLLYGFVRGKNAQLVKSITNDIHIPKDVDIVIEGFVDPEKMQIEGPFGDHTGYYTLEEPYPVMEIETITMKKNPVFQATVVGKPPLEDKYMGWATERIFLPMLKPMAPNLIDYYMPENGVFHNLILGKMQTLYKGHAQQFMHAFWGVGQMSFVKHAIFVNEDAPELSDDIAITEHILNRLDPNKVLITQGIIDALDHTANENLVGGKLGVDATAEEVINAVQTPISDKSLLVKMQELDGNILELKQYFTHTKNPICLITVNKVQSMKNIIAKLHVLSEHVKLLVIVDKVNNDINEPYMLVWRVVNNIDAQRDITLKPFIAVDGTNKSELDGFNREWPGDTFCTKEVLDSLQERGLIDIDDAFIKKFGLLAFD
ncbi:MAG: UbiD family decarboxylase associated with menaquinone via futalosine [uncultured Sulfurovum sp.]|uniref:UbiD family decarboxylase associated with menaquinone via futalosine n=1 Tax=uncultured Sulfurovum sp. TaxID=269237 RepID=A0A6S6TGB7_9BACT|nr:MAG: UbiD family decarboxylase associated with menaquinone via futalosine [uncultured Sulfurovum sp.]